MPSGELSLIDLTLSGTGIPGSQVTVTVALNNLKPEEYVFKITGQGIGISDFEIPAQLVQPYGYTYFTYTFTMPSVDCTVNVISWYLDPVYFQLFQDVLDTKTIYVQGTTAAVLTFSTTTPHTNETITYSFTGFQPNATVTFTLRNASGSVMGSFTKVADGAGSGSGTLYVNLVAGNYTETATDAYGHSAMVAFSVEGIATYGGTVEDFYIQKGASTYKLSLGQIPAVVSADNQAFELMVQFRAASTNPAGQKAFTCRPLVTDPTGTIIAPTPTFDTAGLAPGELGSAFGAFQFPAVNKGGQWLLTIQFMLDDGTVVSSWGPLPVFSVAQQTGDILETWINKESEGTRVAMPATVVANKETFEVGCSWKNTSAATYNAYIQISVVDPDSHVYTFDSRPGNLGQPYSMPAGSTRENSWNVTPSTPVPVSKAGAWYCTIKLILDPAGTELDVFSGVCLNATGITGKITGMWYNKGSVDRGPFGAEVVADGQTFEIGVRYKNTTTDTIQAGVQVEVWDPSGIKTATPAIDYTGLAPNVEYETTYQFPKVDKTGQWTVKLKFLVEEDGSIITEWPVEGNGLLFEVMPLASFSDLVVEAYRKKVTGSSASSVAVTEGDIVEVDLSFLYSVPEDKTQAFIAGLNIPPGFDYPLQHNVNLVAGTDVAKTITVEIPISANAGLRNDSYNIRVELADQVAEVQDAVIVSGMPESTLGNIGELVLMVVVVMVMSMMMESMGDIGAPAGAPPRPKPVTEAVGRGITRVAGGIKRVTRYFGERGEEEKRVTEYLEEGEESY